jgi:hypothetical protein
LWGGRRHARNNPVPKARQEERRKFSSENLSGIIEAWGNMPSTQKEGLLNVLVKYVD